MYDTYSPAPACEFPNDNPELHHGARWVCASTRGAPRALLRTEPELRRVELQPEVEPDAPSPVEPQPEAEPDAPAPVALAAPAPQQLALRLTGPLELDLARIVLPHRVADVPPPPEFIFRPFVPARPAVRPALAPLPAEPACVLAALPLLGYRVVDARAAGRRVQRAWRVDIAPCVAIERAAVVPALPALGPPEVSLAAAVFDTFDPVPPPPLLPASEAVPAEPSKKRQRRRAARVASSASLVAAALPGNQELSRALSELDAEFAERRVEQPPAARKRRSRRATPASRPAPAKRAANAV